MIPAKNNAETSVKIIVRNGGTKVPFSSSVTWPVSLIISPALLTLSLNTVKSNRVMKSVKRPGINMGQAVPNIDNGMTPVAMRNIGTAQVSRFMKNAPMYMRVPPNRFAATEAPRAITTLKTSNAPSPAPNNQRLSARTGDIVWMRAVISVSYIDQSSMSEYIPKTIKAPKTINNPAIAPLRLG